MLRRIRNTFQHGWIDRKPTSRGEVFVYRWRERQPQGEYIQRSRQIGLVSELKTTAKAIHAAEHFRIEANGYKTAGQTFAFAALCERYLGEETSGLEKTTRTWYRPWFKNHIIPKWGEMPIDHIKPFAVREWLNALPLSRKSRSHIRDQMKQVFKMAMLMEIIPYQQNPMELVTVKSRPNDKPAKQKRVFTPEEFMAIAEKLPGPYRTMIYVAGCLGLRVSEIVGLQWWDIDFERLEVTIRRKVALQNVGKVKTKKSAATLPLDLDMATILLEYRRCLEKEPKPTDWLFPSPVRIGMPLSPTHVQSKYIEPIAKRVTGEDGIGWHNFRHSYSTLLRELGADIKVQQELLRHADVRTTLNLYTQGSTAQKRKANSKVVSILMRRRPATRRKTKEARDGAPLLIAP